MRKKIRLTEEQLVGIIKKVISEQSSTLQATKTIYNDIVNAVKGLGTNVDLVYKSLIKIKNVDQLKELLSMFKDKRTGYSSFEEMINEEYDDFNLADVKKIAYFLASMNVTATYNSGGSRSELFLGQFELSFPEIKNEGIDYNLMFNKAKDFWLRWLKDPKTKEKFMNLWNFDTNKTNRIFDRYIQIIRNSKLVFFNTINNDAIARHGKGAAGYCLPTHKYTVFVDSNYSNVGTSLFIHELQHLLYFEHPLNPDDNVRRVFAGGHQETEAFKDEERINILLPKKEVNSLDKKLEYLSSKYGFELFNLKRLVELQNKYNIKNPEYPCEETEKLSNIMSIRFTLKLKPGQDITLNMFRDLVNGSYKFSVDKQGDIYLFLMCWAERGFKDPNLLLKQLNYLAANAQKNDIIKRTV